MCVKVDHRNGPVDLVESAEDWEDDGVVSAQTEIVVRRVPGSLVKAADKIHLMILG